MCGVDGVDGEKGWTDDEVVRRWLKVFPKRHATSDGVAYETRPEDVASVLAKADLCEADALYVMNSVRGLQLAQLSDAQGG
ncbi:MAG: hypothetical protein EOL87_03510 [Spartobacteria bacterium]|nr:hypothetical protein [Spartobacteria bacterium]